MCDIVQNSIAIDNRDYFVCLHYKERLSYNGEYFEKDGKNIPSTISPNFISLFPAIAMFDGENGCYASFNKLAAYAGIRKDVICDTIKYAIELNWIKEIIPKNTRKYRKAYTFTSKYNQNAEEWLVIGRKIIENGIWAAMEQTRQIIYTILLAQTVNPIIIFNDGAFNSYGEFEGNQGEIINDTILIDDREVSIWNCDFIRFKDYRPDEIIEIANTICLNLIGKKLSDKTFNNSIKWFQDNGLIYVDDENKCLIIPRNPNCEAPQIKAMIEKSKIKIDKINAEQKKHELNYRAKRSIWAMSQRQEKNQNKVKEI